MRSAALFIARDARAPRQLKEAIHTVLVMTRLGNLLLKLLLLIKVALFGDLRYGILRVSIVYMALLAPVEVRILIADRAWTVVLLIGDHWPLG